MNINDSQQDPDRPEPFSTILDLRCEHSAEEILEAISESALFDSEDEECFRLFRAEAALLHLELERLLGRMADVAI